MSVRNDIILFFAGTIPLISVWTCRTYLNSSCISARVCIVNMVGLACQTVTMRIIDTYKDVICSYICINSFGRDTIIKSHLQGVHFSGMEPMTFALLL